VRTITELLNYVSW